MVPLATIVKAIHNKVAIGINLAAPFSLCTEGWDCGLGSQGLNFFGNNGLGASWDPTGRYSFYHGTLSEHFQGVVKAFGSRLGGEKRVKMG